MIDDIKIVEYKYLDGCWTFLDSEMLWFYRNLDGKESNFYNVEFLDDWNPIPYWRSTKFFMLTHNEEIYGAIWISGWNPLNRSGFFNFGVVKSDDYDLFSKIAVIKRFIRHILSLPEFQLLYAETSVSETATISLAEYLGFKIVGQIPHAHWDAREGKFLDTVFMYVTLEDLK